MTLPAVGLSTLPQGASALLHACVPVKNASDAGMDLNEGSCWLHVCLPSANGLVQTEIADNLLGALRMEAGLSLEPILVLVAALARDLQADFLPYFPRLAAALTALVEQGEIYLTPFMTCLAETFCKRGSPKYRHVHCQSFAADI